MSDNHLGLFQYGQTTNEIFEKRNQHLSFQSYFDLSEKILDRKCQFHLLATSLEMFRTLGMLSCYLHGCKMTCGND